MGQSIVLYPRRGDSPTPHFHDHFLSFLKSTPIRVTPPMSIVKQVWVFVTEQYLSPLHLKISPKKHCHIKCSYEWFTGRIADFLVVTWNLVPYFHEFDIICYWFNIGWSSVGKRQQILPINGTRIWFSTDLTTLIVKFIQSEQMF